MEVMFLPKNLARLSEFCAREEGRFAMQGVRVTLSEEGYKCEATNGKYACTVTGPSCPPPEGQFKDRLAAQASHCANGGTEGIIATKDWKTGLALGDKKDPVVLCLAAPTTSSTFVTEQGTHHFDLLEGRFPAIQQAIPRLTEEGSVVCSADPQLLATLGVLCKAMEITRLDLQFFKKGSPIGFRGQNDQGQTLEALVMPLA